MERIIEVLSKQQVGASVQAPTPAKWPLFGHFDAANELWKDYLSNFTTFGEAHSVPENDSSSGATWHVSQDAVTCDIGSIKDLLDKAMRTRFICSINNEAALIALFWVKDTDLSFTKAVEIAQGMVGFKVSNKTILLKL
ncbi:hypothetical protein CAPTEDRAFT_191942 [Capitella teleta]|uniref:Uncharacterized protein n=1 Tax=Capitella teleta TaxID=283909 RepID=R7TWX3_CAPTE|nr:hypothetical protein CAPTEDRAFT_191942 [Capitella teleta]|eukprot:ELT95475.1 hypothetical protein CAPTEDRAFT_191942 [Capitella teleta]